MFTNKNYQLLSVLLMFSTNAFSGILILPPSKAPPIERVKKKSQPVPAVEIPKVQTQSGCVSKPDSSAAIPVSQADYLNQGKDSSIQILIEATAKYNAGQMTNEDYIKVAQGVSLRADGYNKIIQTFNTSIGTAGVAGVAGVAGAAGATTPTVAAPKPGPCTISYKCTDAIERQARESQANSINAGASFVWQGLIGETCRYSVLNHCAYWNQADGSHPYSCKDFANQTIFAEQTCTPSGSGTVAGAQAVPGASAPTSLSNGHWEAGLKTLETALAQAKTPEEKEKIRDNILAVKEQQGDAEASKQLRSKQEIEAKVWISKLTAAPAAAQSEYSKNVQKLLDDYNKNSKDLSEVQKAILFAQYKVARDRELDKLGPSTAAPAPSSSALSCPGGRDSVAATIAGRSACSCSWGTTPAGSSTSGVCNGGGNISGMCSSAGKWINVVATCPGIPVAVATPAPAPVSSALSCPGGRDSVAATIAGRSSCSCSWGTTPAGSSTSGVCNGGGNISGMCSSAGKWINVVATCPGIPAAVATPAPAPVSSALSCPGGSDTIPSKVAGKSCSCTWGTTPAGSSTSGVCNGGGNISGMCSSAGAWTNVVGSCP